MFPGICRFTFQQKTEESCPPWKLKDGLSPALEGLVQWNDPGLWWDRALALVTSLSGLQSLIYQKKEGFPSSQSCGEVSSRAPTGRPDESPVSFHSSGVESQSRFLELP